MNQKVPYYIKKCKINRLLRNQSKNEKFNYITGHPPCLVWINSYLNYLNKFKEKNHLTKKLETETPFYNYPGY